MCKSKFKIMRWLLGLAVLAVFAGMSQVAYAQPGLGVGLTQNGGSNLSVGLTYNGVINMVNTAFPSTPETLSGPVLLVPACKDKLASIPCSNPDSGVITVNSAVTSGGTACAGITWTVGGGPGTFTLTPSGTVIFAAFGDSCTITYSATVNSLPTVDSNSISGNSLETDASAAASVTSSIGGAGGQGTTENSFTFVCAVQVDKQISCDGGATWTDTGFADGAANGCIGAVGAADIKVQYVAKNTSDSGIGLISCTIGETNAALGPGVAASFPIAFSATTDALGTSADALVCETAHAGGEPDTGSISCTCNVPIETKPIVTNTDQANFECCGVQVDKQVACSATGPWSDVGFADGTAQTVQCTADAPGAPSSAFFQYLAKNTGTIAAQCGFNDTQNTGGLSIFQLAAGSTTLNVSTSTVTLNPTDVSQACTSTFSGNEPNTGLLSCACSATGLGTVNVTDSDTAKVECLSPGLNVSKVCGERDATSGNSAVTITSTNVGNVALSNCALTDNLYATATTCPACTDGVCPTPSGNATLENGSLTPVNFSLGLNGSQSTTGNIAVPASPSCNTVSVTCDVATGGTITKAANDLCEFTPPTGNCITRTPGYFGTHPAQTDFLMGSGLAVCGLTLTEVANNTNNSATEDLCENNNDANSNNVQATSPQQLQLIRQCTAAALSLVLSGNGGGIGAGELACTSFSNIQTKFESCCTTGGGGLCSSGASPAAIDGSGCIGFLDSFNNQFDNVSFPQGFINENAEPGFCQASSGNHWVNPGRTLGPKK